MKNNSGFSLLEVLIAASILSVVILGVMRVNDNLIAVQQGFEQSQDASEILSNTKLFMGHQLSCMGTLSQAKKSRSNGKYYVPISGQFDSIKNFENNDFLAVGEKFGKVELIDLTFAPRKGYFEEDEFTHERGIVDVRIRMQGVGKTKRPRFRKLPVWVYANKKANQPAEIQYCDSSRSDMVNYITESVMARVCQSLDAILDPETRLCVFGTEFEKREAIKKAQRTQDSVMAREVSSKPVQVKETQLDENTVLMFLMKSMLEETEEKKGGR